MELKVLTESHELAASLQGLAPSELAESSSVSVSEIARVPGAMGGWFELLVAMGLVGAPMAVVCGVVTNWLTKAIEASGIGSRKQPSVPVAIRLVITDGDRTISVSLTATRPDEIERAIRDAYTGVQRLP